MFFVRSASVLRIFYFMGVETTLKSNDNFYVYFYYNNEQEIIYVGQTEEVGRRWEQHKYNEEWTKDVTKIGVRKYPDESSMKMFENCYIRRLCPKYNKAIKGPQKASAKIGDEYELKIYSVDDFEKIFCAKENNPKKRLNYEERLINKGFDIVTVENGIIDFFDEETLKLDLDNTVFKFKDSKDVYFMSSFASSNQNKTKKTKFQFNSRIKTFKDIFCDEETIISRDEDNCISLIFREDINISEFGFLSFGYKCQKIEGYFGIIKKLYNNKMIFMEDYRLKKDGIIIDSFQKEFKADISVFGESKRKQIEKEKQEKRLAEQRQWENEHPNYKEIKKIYIKCCAYLKKCNKDEKNFLMKNANFSYVGYYSEPANNYTLTEIECCYDKLTDCCTEKQMKYIKDLALKKNIYLKEDAYITKENAYKIIKYLKFAINENKEVDMSLPLINQLFNDIIDIMKQQS